MEGNEKEKVEEKRSDPLEKAGKRGQIKKWIYPGAIFVLCGAIIAMTCVGALTQGESAYVIPKNASEQREEEQSTGKEKGKGSTNKKAGATSSRSGKSSGKSQKGTTAQEAEEGTQGEEASGGEEDDEMGRYKPYNTVGNEIGNLANKGLLCEQGQMVYYVNAKDKNCLYEMRKDGGEQRKLTEYAVGNINASNGALYVENLEEERTVGKMLPNGEKAQELHISCESFGVAEEEMVTTDGDSIMRINNESPRDTEVIYQSKEVSKVSTDGERVYFIDGCSGGRLCSMTLAGEEYWMETDCGVSYYALDDAGLYVLSGEEVYANGDWETPALPVRASCINVADGKLYYGNLEDNGRPYVICLDGTGKQKLADRPAYNICIAGGWMAFEADGSQVVLQKIT